MCGADGASECNAELCPFQISGHLLLILQSDFMWSELSLNLSVCPTPTPPPPSISPQGVLKGSVPT